MLPAKSGRNILLVLILLHLCWFVAGLCWRHFYNGDSYEYIYLAENIKHGFYYGANAALPVIDYQFTSRPPLYSLLLLVSYAVFGVTNIPIFILQNILSIASCWMIYDIFNKLFPSRKYVWMYMLFIALYPAQLFFATTLTPDTILQFFLMLYCRELLLSFTSPKRSRILFMSLWLILATLTKPIVYPFLFLHFIYSFWCFFKTRSVSVMLIGILPLAMLTGYGFWNKSRTGLYHISSVQSHNLLNFNARAFLIFKYGQAYSDSVLDQANLELDKRVGLKAKYQFADSAAKKIIRNDLWSYGLFHMKESARFFIEPGKIEIDLFTGYAGYYFHPEAPNFYKSLKESGIAGAWNYLKSYPYLPFILLVILFNFLRIAGWILFLLNRNYKLPLKIFSSLYILYFAAITGPVSNTRYFMPVLLIMSAFSMLGFAGWIEKRKARKQKHSYA